MAMSVEEAEYLVEIAKAINEKNLLARDCAGRVFYIDEIKIAFETGNAAYSLKPDNIDGESFEIHVV